jgi:hypothetical protein
MNSRACFAVSRTAVLAAAIFATAGCFQDRLAGKADAVESTWEEVERLLQKRDDLILESTRAIRAASRFPADDLLAQLESSRAVLAEAATPADAAAAALAQDAVVLRLLGHLHEKPEPSGSPRISAAADELGATQAELQDARLQYRRAIEEYRSMRLRFPWNVVGRLSGFPEHPSSHPGAVND